MTSSELNPAHVPKAGAALLPLAQVRGQPDDVIRNELIDSAGLDQLAAMVEAVDSVDDHDLYRWLEGPEAASISPTPEYVAMTCLTQSADAARLRIRRQASYRAADPARPGR